MIIEYLVTFIFEYNDNRETCSEIIPVKNYEKLDSYVIQEQIIPYCKIRVRAGHKGKITIINIKKLD